MFTTSSDKGGELVVMKLSHMDRLCMEHLNDTNTDKTLAATDTYASA